MSFNPAADGLFNRHALLLESALDDLHVLTLDLSLFIRPFAFQDVRMRNKHQPGLSALFNFGRGQGHVLTNGSEVARTFAFTWPDVLD